MNLPVLPTLRTLLFSKLCTRLLPTLCSDVVGPTNRALTIMVALSPRLLVEIYLRIRQIKPA